MHFVIDCIYYTNPYISVMLNNDLTSPIRPHTGSCHKCLIGR